MAPLSLKIVLDDGAVTRTLMFDTTTKVEQAHHVVRDKIITIDPDKEYGFFLTSADDECSGVWLEGDRTLEYYMLRDGDSLYYLAKLRNLRLRMLDGSVKTLQVDESKTIGELMVHICGRIGITNHEEYGLCREDCDSIDESKPSTGTLTLKKKTIQREKDALLEQLSKKLKTDDNVEWLDQHKTLRESRADPKETLLFKRRLFYSDRNVDSRDPVQLNLLYVQTRDAILDGRQVVTEDKAAEFAGIQCQVQYGDFQEEKHKPGFIENLKEFLPEQYVGSWSIEKKIIKEHRKHHGLSHLDAKHLYTKTARELPTYGVTFFLVKEKQKGKKKLVPRLLGINSESILRLDEETKEILQVWPLTQVKTYRAGSESFTLNFGDYSEKEYAVKTNEAFRIRDILQGYIDIIRKRLAAPYNVHYTEGEAMCEEMVESSRGTLTQNVVPMKPKVHSLVGPSHIISVDQGQQSQKGTRIVTVHEIITTIRGDRSQQPMKGELSRSNSMPHDFGMKLNKLNSESVRTVVLLSDPTKENLQEVRKIVNDFEDTLPSILKGINETAANLKGDESKKLLEELDELCNYINTLAATTKRSDLNDPDNLRTAQDAAKKIADLSTQMFFSLDPKTQRRSKLLRCSRNSFILDEKTEASLRRASFITAADNACQAVENGKAEIDEDYNGPPLSDEELQRLERKTVDRMGKLSAAIALLLNAHADTKNIDYEMAVNSMKTINELTPDFVRDSKPLMSVGDENAKRKLRGQIIQLLDGARNMCMLTGSNDANKLHDEGNAYADVAKQLIFTFNRPDRHTPAPTDQENQIIALAKEVGEKVALLLKAADELNHLESKDPHADGLDAAGAKCADATQGLLACAKLTAPSIHEPHCQSALTAAAENLSSSAQNLALTYKPLVDKPGRHGFAKQLADRVFDLAKSLDKLKGAYANLNVKNNDIPEDDESELQQKERLKFIITSSAAKNALTDADKDLQEMLNTLKEPGTKTAPKNPDARRLLAQKLAQLNAAIASLVQATSDADNPDYDTAGAAVNTISQLTPMIINDTKALHGSVDDNSWKQITESLKEMLEATRGICGNAENCNIGELNEAASKIANSSGKLTFIINPRRNVKKENEVQKLSRSAVEQASQLLAQVDQLAKDVGGEDGNKLDTVGVQVVDATQQLLKTAEITAPSMDDARCQAVLLSAIDRLSDRARNMEQCWKPIVQNPEHRQSGDQLNNSLKQLNAILDKLREACQDDGVNNNDIAEDEMQKKERMQFIIKSSAAKNALMDADKDLEEITKPGPITTKSAKLSPDTRRLLAEKMAQLNAAIASLVQATSDAENPDYNTAGTAVNTICELTPNIINDSKALRGNVDDKSWQGIAENLKKMLEATRGLCANAENCNIEELNEAASEIANSSGKLTFVFNPRRNTKKGDEVQKLSRSAVDQTSQLLAHVDQLAKKIGGDEGSKLDTAGVQVVDAAQQLLKTSEITAPSINDTRCQDVLLSAVDRLSDRARNMEQCYKPIVQTPAHRQAGEQLNHDVKQVNSTLDKLKDACRADKGEESEAKQKERLKFIVTSSAAKNGLVDADKDLQDIIKTGPSTKTASSNPDARRLLSQKLAQLNAAIASLVQATSDADNPDYETAGAAVNTISQLTPSIIKDTKTLHGNVDDNSWREITDCLKDMLEATRGICGNAENCNIEELNEAASKIANSSGKLTFVINPRRNTKKEDEIQKLSRSAVDQTTQLLAHVDQLAKKIGGDEGNKLDTAGVQVVDAAQQLLKTAEITAPSINDTRCQDVLLSAVDRLSDRTRNMEQCYKPIVQTPAHRQSGEQLNHDLKQVNLALDKLKEACLADGGEESEAKQKERLKLINTSSAAKNGLKDADKDLQEILKTGPSAKTSAKSPDARALLSQKLAQLNAAIASLVQATSDANNPDYDTAAVAVNTISQLAPTIIKDTKTLHGNVDEKSWQEITTNLKEMLEATKGICVNAENCNIEELNVAASKIANSSGKLTFVISPRRNAKKEDEVQMLSRSAVDQTTQLLAHVDQLAKKIGGDEGNKLDTAGVQVVDAAQQLLKTVEITAPSINDGRCQDVLLSAVDRLSERARNMEQCYKPVVQTPAYRQFGEQLNHDLKQVNSTLDKLKEACRADDGIPEKGARDNEDQQRTHFIKNLEAVKNAMADAAKEMKEIDKPHSKIPSKNDSQISKSLLSQKLANLNAAIASLLQATSDRENQDYDEAVRAVNTISNITPEIIKDAKILQGTIDDKSWKIVKDNLKTIVATTNDICDKIDDPEEMKKSASQFANSVNKLSYVFNPRNYQKKENQILDLSREAIEQMSLLLSNVYQLAEGVDGEDGEKLDKAGVKVVDSTKILLKTAEITSPTIGNANCQRALLSTIDQVSHLADDLKKTWQPHVQAPKHRQIGNHLEDNLKIVQTTLDKLRAVCQEPEDLEESKPHLLSDLSHPKKKIKDAEKLFSEDKIYDQRATQTGNKNTGKVEKSVLERRLQLSEKLAQLNEAVALLLQAMLDRQNPDYKTAEQTISIISNLTPEIVQETIGLHGNMDDNSREILFKEAKALCNASQEICTSVENNSLEELNQAATNYAHSSGKLRCIVSPRSYPNKEKKILELSRSVCERTSLMLSRVSRLAGNVGADEGDSLNVSGARVADAAQTLLSTAQITAPSISDRNCQSVLASSAETLLDTAQDLGKVWTPMIQQPKNKQIGDQITRDLDLLTNELEVLKTTYQDNTDFNDAVDMTQQHAIHKPMEEDLPKTKGNMENIDLLLEDIYKHSKGTKSEEKPIVIEDTPLRQLATKIMESAKKKAECNKYSEDERKRFAELANKLAAAISKLDIANSRCRDTPFGSKEKNERALQLENAILNLQLLCIQSRQKGGELSNIVDLTEFVDDVTSAVDDLRNIAKGIKEVNGKEAIMEITNKCQKMHENATNLLDPQNTKREGNMSDDALQIDQFAKDCDNQVQAMNHIVHNIADENARKNVIDKLSALEEKCNLLSFAAKSSISNAESATLEESLRNLEHVEKKIEVIIKPVEGIEEQQRTKVKQGDNKQSIQAAQSTLATVIAAGNESKLPKALARYAIQMKIHTNGRNSKLKEHLDRLLDILKLQIAVKNRRVVTWQDVNDEEVYTTTEKILEELDSYANDIDIVDQPMKGAKKDDKEEIVKESDIKSLLSPNTSTIFGEPKELKIKFNQQIQKLNSMTGTIILSINKPESLARSLHTTSEAAAQLSAIARGLKNKDPVQNKRIEETVQEMNIATYQLLKTAESVCYTPKHPESRRRLLEACSLLNDSLNNLARAAVPADKMQRDCNELSRSLQLQQSFLTSEHPSCALSYPDCLDALQNQQDVINKLKSEQTMSRTECGTALRYVSSAICNSAEYASQSAYLLTLSKEDQNAAKSGLVDVHFVKKLADSINETCLQIICNGSEKESKDQIALNKQVQQLQEAVNIASDKISLEDKNALSGHSRELNEALISVNDAFNAHVYEEEKTTQRTMKVIDAINKINSSIDNIPEPKAETDPKAVASSREVLDSTRNLITKTSMMVKKASLWQEEVMTWVTFGSSDVIKAFESLVTCIREKGAEAGLVETIKTSEESNAPVKSYVQTQLDTALSWLRRPASKDNVKADGVKGAENLANMAEQMCEDLHGAEKEEMKHVIVETKQLLKDCSLKYNSDKASLLMERLRELRKMLERGVVTRVVEDFLEEEPLANLENIVHNDNDEKKRKFLLEKKIAELLAQLGRVKKTARFVADTGKAPRQELMKISDQVELLAPSLVKAAQERVQRPDDKAAIEHYQKLLAEYADSLSRVRELCDKAVDPIEFSQAAGETMQRIKEESGNDPQHSHRSPKIIMKLYKRVVDVGMHSDLARNDPELQKTLLDIKSAVEEKQTEAKRADCWRDITAEILRRTEQVESVLGGENIFLKQPEPDQPIYAAALDLHAAVRGWAARDNEIVAVAKRTAVLMAKLSDYMNTGNKRELIFTSNSIVTASREVAELAKKLALECTDIRIRTNLLQVCDQIPTISGQLKMLTTVKSSSLGHQGSVEDQEAMNMLVGNAQNLMISIQEVVKAAASASVKIMSQRGCRMKWVQRSYY